MGTYKDTTPTFNVNTKVRNFGDFCANWEGEKEKLKKTKRSFDPNSDDQNFTTNTRNVYDPVTHKITALSKDEVDDKLKGMEEAEEANEGFSDFPSEENKKVLSDYQKSQIKIAFENTVLCARTNSPKESYDYAERMSNMVINLIEQ